MNDHWNTVLRNTFPLAFTNFRTTSWIIFTFAFSLMSFLKYFFFANSKLQKSLCIVWFIKWNHFNPSGIISVDLRVGLFVLMYICIKIKLCLIYCRGLFKKSLKGGPCHQSMVLILDIRFLIVKVTFTYRRRINRRVFLILQLKIDCI